MNFTANLLWLGPSGRILVFLTVITLTPVITLSPTLAQCLALSGLGPCCCSFLSLEFGLYALLDFQVDLDYRGQRSLR